MAKPRKLKKTSQQLTELLDIDGLTAIGGNEHNINAMNPDTSLPPCVECNGPVENHGRFPRSLIDVINKDGSKQFARLHYYFYKYRCLNPECGAIFQKTISFAKESSKVTKRYENEVVRHAMYESLDNVREEMQSYIIGGHNSDLISKPAMSKLVKRWVNDKDDARKFVTPAGVLIYTYEAHSRPYTVICELDNRHPISVLEVYPNISASAIKGFFSQVEKEYIWTVVIDCNPVVYQTVKEIFPDDRILVDTDSLKHTVDAEYGACVFERAKNYSKEVRRNLKGTGVGLDAEDASKIYSIRRNDSVLRSAYKKYSELYSVLENHRDVFEMEPLISDLSDDNKEIYALSLFYLNSYWSEIVNFYKRRNGLTGDTYEKLFEMNQKFEEYFTKCTDELFRARMLYSKFEELDRTSSWKGMPLDELIEIINTMITEGGLKKHECKRRKNQ